MGTCGRGRLGSWELRGGAKGDAWLLVPFETGPQGAGPYSFLCFGGVLLTFVKNQERSSAFVVVRCGLRSDWGQVGLQPWPSGQGPQPCSAASRGSQRCGSPALPFRDIFGSAVEKRLKAGILKFRSQCRL